MSEQLALGDAEPTGWLGGSFASDKAPLLSGPRVEALAGVLAGFAFPGYGSGRKVPERLMVLARQEASRALAVLLTEGMTPAGAAGKPGDMEA